MLTLSHNRPYTLHITYIIQTVFTVAPPQKETEATEEKRAKSLELRGTGQFPTDHLKQGRPNKWADVSYNGFLAIRGQ